MIVASLFPFLTAAADRQRWDWRPEFSEGQGWPTAAQETLLRAALGDGDRARSAFASWRNHTREAALDPGSRDLLPLLRWNLARLSAPEAAEPPLSTLGLLNRDDRRRWEKGLAIFSALNNEGLSFLVTGALAMALRFYPEPGLRPVSAMDLLVHPADAARAAALLARAGWRADWPLSRGRLEDASDVPGVGPAGPLRLHWRLLAEVGPNDEETALWRHAVSFRGEGVSFRVPCDTDLLLETCIRGAAWSARPDLLWVADAALLLKTATINWDALLERARALQLLAVLREALRTVAAIAEAPLPAGLLRRWEGIAVSEPERAEARARLRRPGFLDRLPALWQRYRLHAAAGRRRSRWSRLRGFPSFVATRVELPGPWSLPVYALRRAWARRFWYAAQVRALLGRSPDRRRAFPSE